MIRTVQFKILLTPDERRWLEDAAEYAGLTESDLLRLHIRELQRAKELRERLFKQQDHTAAARAERIKRNSRPR